MTAASPGKVSAPAEPCPDAAVPEVDGLEVHEGTAAHDGSNARAGARLDRVLRDAPATEGPMEPDATHAALESLLHDTERGVRMGGHDHAIDVARHAREVRIAPGTLDLCGVRVDRDRVVAAVPELAEHGIGRARSRSRDARDGNSFPAQNLRNGLGGFRHRSPPTRKATQVLCRAARGAPLALLAAGGAT